MVWASLTLSFGLLWDHNRDRMPLAFVSDVCPATCASYGLALGRCAITTNVSAQPGPLPLPPPPPTMSSQTTNDISLRTELLNVESVGALREALLDAVNQATEVYIEVPQRPTIRLKGTPPTLCPPHM